MAGLNELFFSPGFLLAGAACALGPLVLHLWNRRRFQTLKWAAMDFLEQALQDRRRRLELRDVLILFLRMAALALFGAALSQPLLTKQNASQIVGFLLSAGAILVCLSVAVVYWKNKTACYAALATAAVLAALRVGTLGIGALATGAPDQTLPQPYAADAPVHVVLLIDNSLSMGYQSLGRSVFSAAKQRARELLETLPLGSKISLAPLSEPNAPPSTLLKSAALEALEQLRVVDRAARYSAVAQIVQRYAGASSPLPLWFVLIGDQQIENWRESPHWADGEINLHVVDVSPKNAENIWLADLYLQDDVADHLNPAVFVVKVRSSGLKEATTTTVRLIVEGVEFGSRMLSFPAGDAVRVVSFSVALPATQQAASGLEHVVVSASLVHDRLSADDQRTLLAPVASGLPVVFIDQYGRDESPLLGQLGETRHVRRLLASDDRHAAPTSFSKPAFSKPALFKPVLLQPDEVTRKTLAQARLVFVAGVGLSEELARILAEYVWQGGRLWIAAGDSFDIASWNRLGGSEQFDFLPAPLLPAPFGVAPAEVAPGETLEPFSLSFDSMRGQRLFQLADASAEELAALYAEPLFFKAIRVDLAAAAGGGPNPRTPFSFDRDKNPEWLQRPVGRWRRPANHASSSSKVVSSEVDVLASYDNGEPFLLARTYGAGRVVFMTTALLSDWNTLPKTNAFLICDRLARALIRETLPQVNFGEVEHVTIPAPAHVAAAGLFAQWPQNAQRHPLVLRRANNQPDEIRIDAPFERGVYRVVAPNEKAVSTTSDESPNPPTWETAVAVNGSEEESSLKYARPSDLAWLASSSVHWVEEGEPIRLQTRAEQANVWRVFVFAAFLVLLAEMAFAVQWDAIKLRGRWFKRTGGPPT